MTVRLVPLARGLRKKSTDTENFLWRRLKAKQLGGFKFRRQAPIGPYIADFVCPERRVVIECYGSQHLEQKNKDRQRDQWLCDQGYCVLRFWDNQILQNVEVVLEEIYKACISTSPSP